jgi:hypothetical protein
MLSYLVTVLSQHLLLLASFAIGFFLIIILLRVAWLYRRLERMLAVGNVFNNGSQPAQSIEQALGRAASDLGELRKFTKDMEQYLMTVERRLKKSVQAVGTVRYNPFRGTGDGGNNSFSTAFLNEAGDGLIVTSLYSRDRISVFGKPVKNFVSEHELSEEEREAINVCQQKIKAP